jgi:anti-anti-sigma regulatory factor
MANKMTITLKAIPEKGRNDKVVVLVIQGELSLDNSSKVRDFLIDNLNKYEDFTIKISDVSSIDLSILQLLQRFIWDADTVKKNIKLELNLTPELELFLEKSGFKPFIALSNTK